MARYEVCRADDVDTGTLKTVMLGRTKAILSRLPDGTLRAFSGRCPHHGADLSFGSVEGSVQSDTLNCLSVERQGEVLRCPWHGFEFNLLDGSSAVPATNGMTLTLRMYDVAVENGTLVITT